MVKAGRKIDNRSKLKKRRKSWYGRLFGALQQLFTVAEDGADVSDLSEGGNDVIESRASGKEYFDQIGLSKVDLDAVPPSKENSSVELKEKNDFHITSRANVQNETSSKDLNSVLDICKKFSRSLDKKRPITKHVSTLHRMVATPEANSAFSRLIPRSELHYSSKSLSRKRPEEQDYSSAYSAPKRRKLEGENTEYIRPQNEVKKQAYSETARKILETLDQLSSPILDVKRVRKSTITHELRSRKLRRNILENQKKEPSLKVQKPYPVEMPTFETKDQNQRGRMTPQSGDSLSPVLHLSSPSTQVQILKVDNRKVENVPRSGASNLGKAAEERFQQRRSRGVVRNDDQTFMEAKKDTESMLNDVIIPSEAIESSLWSQKPKTLSPQPQRIESSLSTQAKPIIASFNLVDLTEKETDDPENNTLDTTDSEFKFDMNTFQEYAETTPAQTNELLSTSERKRKRDDEHESPNRQVQNLGENLFDAETTKIYGQSLSPSKEDVTGTPDIVSKKVDFLSDPLDKGIQEESHEGFQFITDGFSYGVTKEEKDTESNQDGGFNFGMTAELKNTESNQDGGFNFGSNEDGEFSFNFSHESSKEDKEKEFNQDGGYNVSEAKSNKVKASEGGDFLVRFGSSASFKSKKVDQDANNEAPDTEVDASKKATSTCWEPLGNQSEDVKVKKPNYEAPKVQTNIESPKDKDDFSVVFTAVGMQSGHDPSSTYRKRSHEDDSAKDDVSSGFNTQGGFAFGGFSFGGETKGNNDTKDFIFGSSKDDEIVQKSRQQSSKGANSSELTITDTSEEQVVDEKFTLTDDEYVKLNQGFSSTFTTESSKENSDLSNAEKDSNFVGGFSFGGDAAFGGFSFGGETKGINDTKDNQEGGFNAGGTKFDKVTESDQHTTLENTESSNKKSATPLIKPNVEGDSASSKEDQKDKQDGFSATKPKDTKDTKNENRNEKQDGILSDQTQTSPFHFEQEIQQSEKTIPLLPPSNTQYAGSKKEKKLKPKILKESVDTNVNDAVMTSELPKSTSVVNATPLTLYNGALVSKSEPNGFNFGSETGTAAFGSQSETGTTTFGSQSTKESGTSNDGFQFGTEPVKSVPTTQSNVSFQFGMENNQSSQSAEGFQFGTEKNSFDFGSGSSASKSGEVFQFGSSNPSQVSSSFSFDISNSGSKSSGDFFGATGDQNPSPFSFGNQANQSNTTNTFGQAESSALGFNSNPQTGEQFSFGNSGLSSSASSFSFSNPQTTNTQSAFSFTNSFPSSGNSFGGMSNSSSNMDATTMGGMNNNMGMSNMGMSNMGMSNMGGVNTNMGGMNNMGNANQGFGQSNPFTSNLLPNNLVGDRPIPRKIKRRKRMSKRR